MVGDKRKGLLQRQARRSTQFLPAHFGQGADVFIAQAAHAKNSFGRFAHADEPRGAVGAGREMSRRHVGDAVAVIFISRAKGHVPA